MVVINQFDLNRSGRSRANLATLFAFRRAARAFPSFLTTVSGQRPEQVGLDERLSLEPVDRWPDSDFANVLARCCGWLTVRTSPEFLRMGQARRDAEGLDPDVCPLLDRLPARCRGNRTLPELLTPAVQPAQAKPGLHFAAGGGWNPGIASFTPSLFRCG